MDRSADLSAQGAIREDGSARRTSLSSVNPYRENDGVNEPGLGFMKEYEFRQQTLGYIIQDKAEACGEKTFLEYEDGSTVTYRELDTGRKIPGGSKMDESKQAGKPSPTFDDLKPMLRPTGVMSGVMKVDPKKCSELRALYRELLLQVLGNGREEAPQMKASALCFSCFNCMAACPKDAISIVGPYEVRGGFFDTGFPEIKMPLEPKDKDGKPDDWNVVERIILERRSVRNFKKDPVPDHLIRRVLEAGRFAPSGGNHQPWKFAVVTDKGFIDELETAIQALWASMYPAFLDDSAVMNLVGVVPTGIFEPRTQYGFRCTATKELPVFLNAPCVIFLGGNEKLNDAVLEIGICGQNMNIVAASLGLGFCWSNFGGKGVNLIPELKAKLGYEDPSWNIVTAAVLGYPKFKQSGMVPRHKRPVTWFRPDSKGPRIRGLVRVRESKAWRRKKSGKRPRERWRKEVHRTAFCHMGS